MAIIISFLHLRYENNYFVILLDVLQRYSVLSAGETVNFRFEKLMNQDLNNLIFLQLKQLY
jgi:hypothetical protein